MSTLSPGQAARVAQGVYRLRQDSVSAVHQSGRILGCEDLFAVDDSSRFTGRSGGLAVWKEITGFGYIAEGKGSYQGEILLVTRGTEIFADWLTNLNIGLQSGPSGRPVHAGFNQTWRTYAPEVKAFLRNRNPTTIHCVGHSLGGALAHLNADMLSAARVAQVKLYTFGAPRSGMSMFAESLSGRIGGDNMYRVFHAADPVPMVPLFPFFHAPTNSLPYLVRNGNAGFVRKDAHLMPSYITGVSDLGWAALSALPEPPMSDAQMESWLGQTAATNGPAIAGSAYALKLISRAIRWILKATAGVFFNTLSMGITASLTAIDQLAWLLERGARMSQQLGEAVANLMKVIFKFLGHKFVEGEQLTMLFIRWVLNMFLASLGTLARTALFLVGK